MNLPGFSTRRPVLTTMVTLIVLVIGSVSLMRTRIDMLPAIELPSITIRTEYEGASPEVMERLVTQIVEEIVATVPGVKEIASQSAEGVSNVQVTFVWGTDIDTAAIDVRGKLEDEIDELPDEIIRPTVNKFDITSFPVLVLGISSKLDPVELTQLIEDHIRHRFSRIPDVAQADLWGGFHREVRIELDPDRIKALGLPLDTVLESIRNANLDLPAGELEHGRYEMILRAPAEFSGIDQIRSTVVTVRDGAAVTVDQIARVRDTYEKLTRIVRVNGERGIPLAIRKQANANTVEVARRVLQEVDAINEAYPQIRIVPVINQGNFIERSIHNVANSVLYGGGLALLVLLFFLANLRSTFIISAAIPISMVATFALIYFSGLTMNLMTLGGLALGVGMMVDSSIVVIENVFRRRDELGEAAPVAAVEGAREVGPAIVASTVTTVVVFLPPSDEGEVRLTGEMELGTRLSIVDRQTRKMERVVAEAVPETVASVVSVGASGRRPDEASRGEIRLSLPPAGERARSNVEIAADLRDRLEGRIAGMKVRVRAPQGQFLLERLLGGEDDLEIEVRGFDLDTLDALARRAAAVAAEVPGVTDVDTTRDPGVPQQEIRIDRAKVADLGLSIRDVTQALKTAVAGSRAGEYRTGGNSYRILVKLRDAELLSLDEILGLSLTTAAGSQVILRNLVESSAGRGPLLIDRKDQQRIVMVRANVAGRSLGEVARDVQERLREIPRPANYELAVAGNFEEQQEAFSELLISLLLAVLLVYMVLASQYESLTNPLIVMFSVPVAAVGVLVTLFLTGTTVNVQSFIGTIMLGGIVVNNAILLVDQAARLRRDGMDVRGAALEAGRRRLRPILMTTVTTVLGLLPLALGIGEGADAQAPLARAVIGGLVGATPITLLLIPAIYLLMHRKRAGRTT